MWHITNCKTVCNQTETTLKYCQHINLQMTHQTLFVRLSRQHTCNKDVHQLHCNYKIYCQSLYPQITLLQALKNSRTFKYLGTRIQGLTLFSIIFKALNLEKKNSRTFKHVHEPCEKNNDLLSCEKFAFFRCVVEWADGTIAMCRHKTDYC